MTDTPASPLSPAAMIPAAKRLRRFALLRQLEAAREAIAASRDTIGAARNAKLKQAEDSIAAAVKELAAIEHASTTCPECGLTSFNPSDVSERYCDACGDHHANLRPSVRT